VTGGRKLGKGGTSQHSGKNVRNHGETGWDANINNNYEIRKHPE